MQRIIIFGGAGFMGRALAAHLRRAGREVLTPDHAAASVESQDALEHAIAAAEPDAVVNLAGISSVLHADERALYEINAFGHLRVLQAVAARAPGARVLLASSANVYGQRGREKLRETDAAAPVNHYAISKLMAENFNRLYADQLAVSAARPFNCTGRGQSPKFVAPKIVDAFQRRLPVLEIGDLGVERDYVDIRDVCEMWRVLIDAEAPPEAINFGTGEATSLAELVDMLAGLSGHRPEVVSAAQFMRRNDIPYQRADTTRLSSLGFERRYALKETLAWMLSEDGEAP